MVTDVAARLDPAIDPAALWNEWLRGGLPSAARIAGLCFARAEEHRWREQSAQRSSPPPLLSESEAADGEGIAVGEILSDLDRPYLAVQIADRRRFDALRKQIGRASCRERACQDAWISGAAVSLKKK